MIGLQEPYPGESEVPACSPSLGANFLLCDAWCVVGLCFYIFEMNKLNKMAFKEFFS